MALADLLENPEALAGFAGIPFALPGSPEATASFRALQRRGILGLEELLAAPAPDEARRKAVEDALFARQEEVLTREAADLERGIKEGTFARGVGLSTITGDLLDRLTRERMDAKTRARREAFLGAGAESRADQAARLAAMGQAVSQGTTGIQAEANVGLTEAGRQQQAKQFSAETTFRNLLERLDREQRGTLFTRGLESTERRAGAELGARERISEKGFESAEEIANTQLLAAGAGGLAQIFGPSFADWLFG